jgi:hypothetical protein
MKTHSPHAVAITEPQQHHILNYLSLEREKMKNCPTGKAMQLGERAMQLVEQCDWESNATRKASNATRKAK